MASKAARPLLTQPEFVERTLNGHRHTDNPLIVFRLRDLARLSWKHGRAHADQLERSATATFSESGALMLRDADCMVHDTGSEWYAIILHAQGRSGRPVTPGDTRNTLTRMHTVFERQTCLEIDSGWTTISNVADCDVLENYFEEALVKGTRERERYAFFSLIGHELRTPLTSIRGYLETVLADDLDAITSRRFIEIAFRETLRVGRIVESLYDISLLDLRSANLPIQQTSLRSAIDSALVATTRLRKQNNTTLRVTFERDVNLAIGEDALIQIFVNLIDNAVKHGRRGGTVTIWADFDDDRIAKISVDDDGPGIPPDQRKPLFELGERGQTSAQGSGIGLGLVRLFLERAGGEIAISESASGGSSFRLTLCRS